MTWMIWCRTLGHLHFGHMASITARYASRTTMKIISSHDMSLKNQLGDLFYHPKMGIRYIPDHNISLYYTCILETWHVTITSALYSQSVFGQIPFWEHPSSMILTGYLQSKPGPIWIKNGGKSHGAVFCSYVSSFFPLIHPVTLASLASGHRTRPEL